LRFAFSHPCDKDRNVTRMGHPAPGCEGNLDG
jgi:hypothetical protein